eukprot:GDKI01043790.1.p1 GENE.GDKI01043790.1~~GDKI01043790.1.p1  ORF type:complete len:1433 (+),score=480.23 GDKI01043790.1:114-4412(+)
METQKAEMKGESKPTNGDKQEKNEHKSQTKPASIGQMYRYTGPLDWFLMVCGVICAMAQGASMPLFFVVLGQLVNELGGGSTDFWPIIRWLLILMGCTYFVSFVELSSFEIVGERISRKIRVQYFRAIMRQEMGWFDTHDPGELSSRIAEDVVIIREGLGAKSAQGFENLSMFCAGFIIGFIQSWELTLVVTSCLPLIAITCVFLISSMHTASTKSQAAFSESGSIAEEAFANFRTLAAFTNEKNIFKKFCDKLAMADRALVLGATATGVGLGSMMCTLFLTFGLGFWYAGKLVADSKEAVFEKYPDEGCAAAGANCVDGGDLLTVFMCVLMSSFALGAAAPALSAYSKARSAAGRVYELIDRKSPIDPYSTEGTIPKEIHGKIEFKNIDFAFPSRKEKQIFKNMSLTVEAGQTVALVGASGCGKSTTVSLFERFYDPDNGQVLLDGTDVRELNVGWLRQQIGFVTQEPRLFNLTVAQNIAHGKPNATREEIIQAAKSANAHDFIMQFPKGYDTPVGEGGGQLSGGQKQRIAIARAIIRDPSVLLLDEATSALDNESEKVVQEALDRLMSIKKRTTIIIAHRLTTIRNADKIAVFENTGDGSTVTEEGTHDELIRRQGGIYRALCMAHEKDDALPTPVAHGKRNASVGGEMEMMQLGDSNVHNDGFHPKDFDAHARERAHSLEHHLHEHDGTGRMSRRNSDIFSELGHALANDFLSHLSLGFALKNLQEVIEPKHEEFNTHTHDGSKRQLDDALSHGSRSRKHTEELHFRRHSNMSNAGHVHVRPVDVETASPSPAGEAVIVSPEGVKIENETADKTAGKSAQKKPKAPTGRLFKLVRGEWYILFLGTLGAAVGGLQFPIFSIVFSRMIAVWFEPLAEDVREGVNMWSLLFLGLGLTGFVTNFLQFSSFGLVASRLTRRLREQMFESLLRQECAFHDDPSKTPGALAASLAADTTIVKGLVSDPLSVVIGNICGLVSGLVIAFVASPELAGVVIAGMFILIPAEILQQRIQTMGTGDQNKNAQKSTGHVVTETVSTMRVVCAYGLENTQLAHYDSLLAAQQRTGIKNAVSLGGGYSFSQGSQFAFRALAFWYGSRMMTENGLGLDKMLECVFAIMMAGAGAGQNALFATDKRKAEEACVRVFEVIDRPTKIDPYSESGLKPVDMHGDIELSGCQFFYPHRAEQQIFSDVSVKIPAGKTVALVGASGCGKSTVIQLLERFYDIDPSVDPARVGGRVCVDGVDVRDLNVKHWRSQVGLVGQEPVLFQGTIRENIAWGALDPSSVTLDQVIEAAKMANAHDFIDKFPAKYDTQVGARGGQLSGGQKQRIAIARAIIRDPKLLLLDEATSALDNESEKVVQEALDRLMAMKKRTTIVIAHRLTTIRNADKIVVFANPDRLGSKVVEEGTHDELMKIENGVYRQLVEVAHATGDKEK